jgi:hypothetical protein
MTRKSKNDTSTASSNGSIRPLLVSRKDAGIMLGGIDASTLRRFEKQGILIPRRINRRSPTAQVFYATPPGLALLNPFPQIV